MAETIDFIDWGSVEGKLARRVASILQKREAQFMVFDTQEEADAFVLAHSRRLNRVYADLGLPPLYPEVKEEDDDGK